MFEEKENAPFEQVFRRFETHQAPGQLIQQQRRSCQAWELSIKTKKKLVDKLPGCLHHSFDCPNLSGGAVPAHLLYLTKFLSNDVSFFGQNLSFF